MKQSSHSFELIAPLEKHSKQHHPSQSGKGKRVAIIAAKFNGDITQKLTYSAIQTLQKYGVNESDIEIFWCPGAFEIPLLAQETLLKDSFDGAIAIGAVIRGGTPHFDYVCKGVTDGVLQVMLQTRKPVSFCVLTTDTYEQAFERTEGDMDKGNEAALGLLEMLSLLKQDKEERTNA